jgi:phage protein U
MENKIHEVLSLTKVEEDILLNGKIYPDETGYFVCKEDQPRVTELEKLMDKYNYGWYIASESWKEQVVSIGKFKEFILTL